MCSFFCALGLGPVAPSNVSPRFDGFETPSAKYLKPGEKTKSSAAAFSRDFLGFSWVFLVFLVVFSIGFVGISRDFLNLLP